MNTQRLGGLHEAAPIKTLLLKSAEHAFVSQDKLDAEWQRLNYTACPDFARARAEYDAFVNLLQPHVQEILYLPPDESVTIDSIYVRDASIVTPRGMILCSMGKDDRRREPDAQGSFFAEAGIPILGAIEGEGRLEGGDLVWLDERTLAVGQGYRTNAEGIRQLRNLGRDFVEEVAVVPLPHWDGPGDVMHLMSILSPLDEDLLLVYSRLMPVPFRQWLIARGYRLIDIAENEFYSKGCNVLALGPRKCLVLAGNPQTRRRLEAEGVEIIEYVGEEISNRGSGGPTCLTRPLWRAS